MTTGREEIIQATIAKHTAACERDGKPVPSNLREIVESEVNQLCSKIHYEAPVVCTNCMTPHKALIARGKRITQVKVTCPNCGVVENASPDYRTMQKKLDELLGPLSMQNIPNGF